MLDKLCKFIEKESLFSHDDRLLLAISGGKDSIVMLHLFAQLPYTIGVAHYNHKLRGSESDEDEAFVRKTCESIGLDYHGNKDYVAIAEHTHINNTQDRARKERYEFLENVAKNEQYNYILTAHHSADNVETFLLQLVRSAGLDGLTAMYPKRSNLCRPLLFATRKEIDLYYEEHHLKHREDQSNASNKYRRNLIRNEILPHFDQINEHWEKTVSQSIYNLQDSKQLLEGYIASHKSSYLIEKGERYILNKEAIKGLPGRQTLLYYLLNPFGFNSSQVSDIHKQFTSMDTGAQLHSPSYTILNDRDQMIIYSSEQKTISEPSLLIHGEGKFTFHNNGIRISQARTFVKNPNSKVACFNLAKVVFPLRIRTWKSGDIFCPLGMDGKKKKVKEFLIDQKISRIDKEEVMVLLSNDQIMWIVGHRIDERYKVLDSSMTCLEITVDKKVI